MRVDESLRIVPLGPEHDRGLFVSGVEELDVYFQRYAAQDLKRKAAAPFVMVDGAGLVLGYYTLSAYSIRAHDVPEPLAKKLPRYPVLPATLLGRLAVGQSQQGKGLGRLLLMDALWRSWKSTAEVASVGVVTEAIDELAVAFYRHHEFLSMLDHPRKLFLPMKTIERSLRLP